MLSYQLRPAVIATWCLVGFCLGSCGVNSCGVSLHIETAERALYFLDIQSKGVNYKELIQNHPDAYQAGCPYPDAYYPGICFGSEYSDVSEDTHWVPFMNASITYIRNMYPRPWNETGEKLVAFLLAVVSHQVADVNWHSLGIDEGYLRTMANVNYHGSFSAAHQDGDFGGDVMNMYQLDMSYIPVIGDWYVPVHDLLNIYELMYGSRDRMTSEVVVQCTNLLFLARLGESLGLVEYLYPFYASRSPFLVDRLDDYFLGGIDDMTVWSTNLYQKTVLMLDEGTQVCSLPENPLYIECDPDKAGSRTMIQTPKPRNPGINSERIRSSLSRLQDGDFFTEQLANGVVFRASDQYKRRLMKKMARVKRYRERVKNRTKHARTSVTSVLYTTNLPYSRLGQSLLSGDVNNDGNLDLIVSAPGHGTLGNYGQGRVYIIHGDPNGVPRTNLTLESDADLILDGSESNGRFGTSLALVDINADGYNDLAVSAPYVETSELKYSGRVYIYFGTSDGLSSSVNMTIKCTERYCNFGWHLTSGDVNHDGYNDLIIGSPFAACGGEQRGFVGVLYAKEDMTVETNLTETDLDWRSNGNQDYEWFGSSVTFGSNGASSGKVIIGSPTFRLCSQPDCKYDSGDVQSAGKLTVFNTPLDQLADLTLLGTLSFGQLGYSVQAYSQPGQQLLAVTETLQDSAEGVLETGHVTIFNWSDTSWQSLVNVTGDRRYDRLGKTVQFSDVDGDSRLDIVITAPSRSESVASGREEGRVYIFYDVMDKIGHTLSSNEADVVLVLNEEKAKFGYSAATLRSTLGSVQMAVGSPRSNMASRLGGLVAVYQF